LTFLGRLGSSFGSKENVTGTDFVLDGKVAYGVSVFLVFVVQKAESTPRVKMCAGIPARTEFDNRRVSR
jgi:hypothetical protein